jgi:flagellar M-ring protein FliF
MEANGTKRVLVAPAPERIKVIHDLVAAASGLNPERGDQLIVESLPFETTLDLDAPAGPEPVKPAPKQATPLEQLQKNPKILIGAVTFGLLVIGGGIFMWIKLRRSKATTTMKVPEALPPAEQKTKENTYPQQMDTIPAEPPPASLSPGRVEVLTNQIRSTAQRTPEICVGVLRGWLREERT